MHTRGAVAVLLAMLLTAGLAAACSDDPAATPGDGVSSASPAAAGPTGDSQGIDAQAVLAGLNRVADRAGITDVNGQASSRGTCLLLDGDALFAVAQASGFQPAPESAETLLFGRDEQLQYTCALASDRGNVRVTVQRVGVDTVQEFVDLLGGVDQSRQVDTDLTAAGLPDDSVFAVADPAQPQVTSAAFLQDGITITIQANPSPEGEPPPQEDLLAVLGQVVRSVQATVAGQE